MHIKKWAAIVTLLAALTMISVTSSAVASPPGGVDNSPGGFSVDGTVVSGISYQGRLTDSGGNPLQGNFNFIFQLWDAASGGTQLGGDIVKNNVAVSNGQFTVRLDIASGLLFYVDGRGLWLAVKVNGQLLSPRQELLPVPYALSLRPGAIISSGGPDTLHVYNTAGGWAVEAWSQNNIGVLGTNGSSNGSPPSGMHGVHGVGAGVGVYGQGGHTGVYGNGSSYGVKGESSSGDGVVGKSTATGMSGVYGESTKGNGVSGESTAADKAGVYGHSSSGVGVRGRSDSQSGVVGWTGTSTQSEISGVFGHSLNGTGVTGRSTNYNGIKAVTQSNEHAALAAGNEGAGPAIYAQGGTQGISAVFRGNVRVQSLETGATILELGEGLDFAEGFDVAAVEGIQPGAVLVIDAERRGQLTLSDTAYDRKVAGIVAGAGGLGSGVRLGADQHDVDVALAGRVYCNVDATYGAIEAGDLLTTSPTPGYAMKVLDHTLANGAILGKAMEGLAAGEKGQILVLVTLQ